MRTLCSKRVWENDRQSLVSVLSRRCKNTCLAHRQHLPIKQFILTRWCCLVLVSCVLIAAWSPELRAQEAATSDHTKNTDSSGQPEKEQSTSGSDTDAIEAVRQDVLAGIDAALDNDGVAIEKPLSPIIQENQRTIGQRLPLEKREAVDQPAVSSGNVTQNQTDTSSPDEKVTPKNNDEAPTTQPSPDSRPKIVRANCGPILLEKVFEKYGIQVTVDDLVKQSNTRLGMTTLYDMKRTALERGLHVEGVKCNSQGFCGRYRKYLQH